MVELAVAHLSTGAKEGGPGGRAQWVAPGGAGCPLGVDGAQLAQLVDGCLGGVWVDLEGGQGGQAQGEEVGAFPTGGVEFAVLVRVSCYFQHCISQVFVCW